MSYAKAHISFVLWSVLIHTLMMQGNTEEQKTAFNITLSLQISAQVSVEPVLMCMFGKIVYTVQRVKSSHLGVHHDVAAHRYAPW